jgi:UDP-N-acetylmuramoyl-tripeptide--D-alanyl-D-alanine ligase
MIPLGLPSLADLLGARLVVPADTDVDRLQLDTVMTDTRVTPAEGAAPMFVALPTRDADGHDHVGAARAAGARAALVSRGVADAGIPQLVVADTWQALTALARHNLTTCDPRVVAITGSYGKTTTKDLAAAALATQLRVVASRASFNNELGVPLTMLEVAADTQVLIAEVGARNAGDLSVMAELLRPHVSVVTTVGPVHLETFGDEDGVAREKGRLVEGLRVGGTAVLNGDDARVLAMRPARLPDGDVLHVSASGGPADLVATDVELTPDGRAHAAVSTPWGPTRLELPIPGRHHLTNALLALAIAGLHGIAPGVAAAGIAQARTSASRASLHRVAGVTVLDDSYNASAPTVIGALETLAELAVDGRRWAVLGEMRELGPTSTAQHRAVGAACRDRIDRLVVVGTAADPIAEGAILAGLGEHAVHRVADRDAALTLLAGAGGLEPGDAVLLKASRAVGLDGLATRLIAELSGRGSDPATEGRVVSA